MFFKAKKQETPPKRSRVLSIAETMHLKLTKPKVWAMLMAGQQFSGDKFTMNLDRMNRVTVTYRTLSTPTMRKLETRQNG